MDPEVRASSHIGAPISVSRGGFNVRCLYLDHTSESFDHLGAIHLRLSQAPPEQDQPGLLLHTCHRVEWYSQNNGVPIPELARGRELRGEQEALNRLSKIASGVFSVVVGDSLVYRQVTNAGAGLARSSPLNGLLDRSAAIAREARRRFDLVPVVDYADVLQLLRSTDTESARRAASRLIIVGGGMLAQAVSVSSRTDYRDVVMVTRNPARLRTTLAALSGLPDTVSVVSPTHAVERAVHEPFDLVLATTSANRTYLRHIAKVASHANVCRIVDYSAAPLFPRTAAKYSHISDSHILALISEANRPVQERAEQAKAWIDTVTTAGPVVIAGRNGWQS